ncbi:MAG: hypothetical protein H6816_10400 [Phycisphaerales bacterium]|nr:hypothetical protein [Phycisphaerales bacterium]
MSARLRDLPLVTGTCRRCGRAVAGFPGDFAKCSHCSVMTQMPLTPPPGWRLVAHPDRLTALPFYMIATFYLSIVAIAWTGGGSGIVEGGIVVVIFAMWIFSIMQFSKAAERQRRWWLPVFLYHFASLLIPLCLWSGLTGCTAVFHGEIGVSALVRAVLSVVGLFVCILIYGFARGAVARLRVVPSSEPRP